MKRILHVFFVAALLLGLGNMLQAQEILLEQPMKTAGMTAATSALTSTVNYEVADNFSGLSGNVTFVEFYGLYAINDGSGWANCTPPADLAFNVRFYAAAETQPTWGSPSVAFVDLTPTVSAEEPWGNGFNRWKFVVELPAPVPVTDGWISVQSSVGTCWFLWHNADGGDAYAFQHNYNEKSDDNNEFAFLGEIPTTKAALAYDLAMTLYGTAGETTTVVDIILDSPDHTTLAAAVAAADLVDALSGAGPFTVFAPTNAAFDALPAGLLDELLADPSGDLTSILLYHVVAGKTMSTDLANGQVITTLLGQDITITINNDGVFINGDVEITVVDLEADNGVVHVIDAVLVPDLSIQLYSITFNVDMTGVDGFDYTTDKVFVTGTFAGWAEPGTAGSYELSLVPPTKNSPPFVLYENWDSYTDFTTDISPWIVHHINTGATWGSQDFDFPGEATSFAWMVFNPSQTDPAIDGNHPPVDGDKYLVAIQSQTVNDNKWLVTPEVSFNATSVFSFSAKSITAQYGLERFRVLVSTTGSDPADFTVISPGDYVEAPIDWATFTYPLAAYAGQTGHIAIQYVSHDAFIFMLDALFLNATTDPDPEPDVLIYTVTVDNVEAGEVKYKYFSDAFGSGWAGGEWAGGADRIFQLTADAVRDDVWGVNNTLSVPQVELAEEGILLFPNPVRTILNINSADMIQQVRIFDLTGRMVVSQPVNSNTASVNVSEFRQGVYVMQVMTANGISSKKFTVVK